jgi:hypothetical protein
MMRYTKWVSLYNLPGLQDRNEVTKKPEEVPVRRISTVWHKARIPDRTLVVRQPLLQATMTSHQYNYSRIVKDGGRSEVNGRPV